MAKLDKLSQAAITRIKDINPNKIILVTTTLTNPSIRRIIENNTSGVIEVFDPTGKMLATYSSDFIERFNSMIDDLYAYLDVESDEDMKELRETLGKDGIKTEIDEFFDSNEQHKEFINNYSRIERKYILSLFKKVITGKILLANKIHQKQNIEESVVSKVMFNYQFQPDMTKRNLALIFNSSTIPKDRELLNALREKNINVIVLEHKPETVTNYWKIIDLFPNNYKPIYSTKSKYCYVNF